MSDIPLTVIGGFLGAGKTTLINRLLKSADRRWGVLVNDFGAINIDAELIASRDGDSVALTNGCVCCGMGEDLGAGLQRLVGTDHILIEASGVGDPWRIAQLALVEPGFALGPIVVLVDASALNAHLTDRWIADTVRGQIAAAEIVMLNRSHVGGPAAVQEINPSALVVVGDADLDLLNFPLPTRKRFHADGPSDDRFRTWSWIPPAAFDRDCLRAVLLGLPRSVLRVKGFCQLGAEAEPNLLQYAAGQWAMTPYDARPGLVVIGTREMPDEAVLEALFAEALVGGER